MTNDTPDDTKSNRDEIPPMGSTDEWFGTDPEDEPDDFFKADADREHRGAEGQRLRLADGKTIEDYEQQAAIRRVENLLTAGDEKLLRDRDFQQAVSRKIADKAANVWWDRAKSEGDEWPEADVAAAFAKGIEVPIPTVLAREDGGALLYRGLPNVIFGEGSVGKSWCAAWAVAEEIRRGHHVYVVDYELNLNVWLGRLVVLGLTAEQVIPCFHYLDVRGGKRPPAKLHDGATLAVLDSLSGAIESYGLEPNDTNSIEAVYREAIDPFTACDLAVLVIDHVGHGDKSRPMNSIRKINRVQGAMYRMENVAGRPFGKGQTGESLLYLFKDNAGGLDMPKGAIAAKFVMASMDGGTAVRCQLVGGSDLATLSAAAQQSPMARKKQDILRALQHHGELNRSDMRKHARGKSDFINAALEELVKEGEVVIEHRGNADYFRYAEGDLEP